MSDASKWLGPYTDGIKALDELRRSVAEIIGADPETWPGHGNAPLAIAAAIGLRQAELNQRADAPPATSAELVALIEAVDTLLESAPCECPHRMREERGEHLSHCYLFDLNVARSGAGEKR